MKTMIPRKIAVLLAVTALLNISACGYFLYPERVGQKSGRIDPGILILDAAGLLFGILPGVVALAVDFTTGTIYLSPGQRSVIDKHSRNMALIDGLELKPVDKEDITINQAPVLNEMSLLLGRPVKAEEIKYYKVIDPKSTVAAVKAQPDKV